MAQITPNMQLTVWNNLSDPYDSGQLADNFVKIDLHNHDGSKGVKLDGGLSIKANTISSAQIASESIGDSELKSDSADPGNDADRAVSNDHIKNLTITGDKIANGTINRSKLTSDVIKVPLVYHNSANNNGTGGNIRGSLPEITDSGGALYDGYTIDYGFNISTATSAGTTSPATTGETGNTTFVDNANNAHYVWRLRYTIAGDGNYWYFVGGRPIVLRNNTSSLGSNPSNGYFYESWGSPAKRFQRIKLPFAGQYCATASGRGDIQDNVTAVFRAGLYLGVPTDPIASNHANLIPAVGAAHCLGQAATDQDGVTATTANAVVSVSSNLSSANRLQQVFGYADKSNGSASGYVRTQSLTVQPIRIKNFTTNET